MRKFIREHLYRGKRIDNGEWVYGYFAKYMNIKQQVYSAILVFDEETEDVYSDGITPVVEETVGEYTGLKDRNGAKIFEGDIVKRESSYPSVDVGVVVYRDAAFNLQIRPYKEADYYTYPHFIFESSEHDGMSARIDLTYEYEIIGNIHETLDKK